MNPQPVTPLVEAVETAMVDAIRRALPDHDRTEPLVRRSTFADYQANTALSLAKQLARSPRDLATDITKALNAPDLVETTEVSGPGFINLTLTDTALWQQVAQRLASDQLGLSAPLSNTTILVDYSGPNIAKEMHVGHLRTTIIGDALARIAEAHGATVIRQNHLGDWGTQFGMLIQYLSEHPDTQWCHVHQNPPIDNIAALDRLYKEARMQFDTDSDFTERARSRVVALQKGDPVTLEVWNQLVDVSIAAFALIYDRLGIDLTDADNAGESTYNDHLYSVVEELIAAGIAVESEGAWCVFVDDIKGPTGKPAPLILRKADGGYGYAATDLAALRHRTRDLKADRMLYVVDARQALHFRQVFVTARHAGWLANNVEAIHIPFGAVLGPDGRPFKTRSGGTVRLADLLDQAETTAREVIAEKSPDLDSSEIDDLAAITGIGAVKYADLSNSRVKDYKFDPQRMVAFTGDTGVYLQYAHTRIVSIVRKAGDTMTSGIDVTAPMSPTERALALHLDAYDHALREVNAEYEPHQLCTYLYTLARAFTSFYDANHILKADNDTARNNRLALATLTKTTLAHGLTLLGIKAPERM